MSLRTDGACVDRARDFIRLYGRRHPREVGPLEVEVYLTMLANRRRVAASTHNQALSAALFLYRAVLKAELPWLQNLQRPNGRSICRLSRPSPKSAPCSHVWRANTACWRDCRTARNVYRRGAVLAGEGVDFDRLTLIVRRGKRDEDRAPMLPQALVADLRAQLATRVRSGCAIARTEWPVSNCATRRRASICGYRNRRLGIGYSFRPR